MSQPVHYIILTPVRNERDHFSETIASVVAQSIRPRWWVIIDDGSQDGTAELVDDAARQHDWIRVVHRPDRGFRKQGGGVVEAFYDGYETIRQEPWDYLVKLDGDLSFEPKYFELCFQEFAADPNLGIGGGEVWSKVNGTLINDGRKDPRFHVRGATKIYRRATWTAIDGLIRTTGWDTLDEMKANMCGWRTRSFSDIKVIQLKATGSADGAWRNWFKNGRANYITGYHPLFMLFKCSRRMFERPYGVAALGLMSGFVTGYLRRVPRAPDKELLKYLRGQQMNRLLFRESLWDPSNSN